MLISKKINKSPPLRTENWSYKLFRVAFIVGSWHKHSVNISVMNYWFSWTSMITSEQTQCNIFFLCFQVWSCISVCAISWHFCVYVLTAQFSDMFISLCCVTWSSWCISFCMVKFYLILFTSEHVFSKKNDVLILQRWKLESYFEQKKWNYGYLLWTASILNDNSSLHTCCSSSSPVAVNMSMRSY